MARRHDPHLDGARRVTRSGDSIDSTAPDATRLAGGGDSACGNLSAAAAIALADDPSVTISAALPIYGVFDFATMGAETTLSHDCVSEKWLRLECPDDQLEFLGFEVFDRRSDVLGHAPSISCPKPSSGAISISVASSSGGIGAAP